MNEKKLLPSYLLTEAEWQVQQRWVTQGPTLINAKGVIHAFEAVCFVVNRTRVKADETSRDIRFAVKWLAEEVRGSFN